MILNSFEKYMYLVDIRLKIILFFACLLGCTAELPEDVYIISRLVSYEWGQRTNSSIFQGRKTSGCLYYKKQKGGKWQFSVFKREAGCDQPNAFRSAKDTLNVIRFGPYRLFTGNNKQLLDLIYLIFHFRGIRIQVQLSLQYWDLRVTTHENTNLSGVSDFVNLPCHSLEKIVWMKSILWTILSS